MKVVSVLQAVMKVVSVMLAVMMEISVLQAVMKVVSDILAVVSSLFAPFRARRVLGIFSREHESSYIFLLQILQSQKLFTEVRSVTIRNNDWQQFMQEVSLCDYAVLYHSKIRGRVNITDVTDSLYDEELLHLSKKLGKKNVLVVADDLDSSTAEDKQRILQHQPRIQELATDLILFSRDKMSEREKLAVQLESICKGMIGNVWLSKKTLMKPVLTVLVWMRDIVKNAATVLFMCISIPVTLLRDLKTAVLIIPRRLLGALESFIPQRRRQ